MIGIILLVVLIFALLVFVHELGHFVSARRAGIEVEEFGFGFPPRVYGRKYKGTIYSINALPLGGFVRMKGEDSSDRSAHSFGAARYRDKVKVLLAGVGMNFATAYVLLLLLCLTGLPPVIENQFSLGNPTYSQAPTVMAVEVGEGSPAEAAGIRQGDLIVSGNGQAFESEDDLTSFTRQHAGQAVKLEVKSGSEVKTVDVTLRGPDSKEGFLGVTPFVTYKQRFGIWSPLVALGLLAQLSFATLAGFGGLIVGLFTQAKVSDAVTGPVGIVAYLANIVNLGPSYVALFVVAISISLAVINALPIPALDGGRLFLLSVQRFFGNRISAEVERSIHAVGFVLMLLLLAAVTIFDIQRFF
jgi:regulator of sigma E protease